MRAALIVFVALVGCERAGGGPIVLDEPRLLAALNANAEKALARPAVDQAFEALIEKIVETPALVTVAGSFAGELEQDPALMAATEALFSQLAEEPRVRAAAEAMVAAHPDATPEQIEALFGAQFEKRFETPLVLEGFEKAWGRWLAGPTMAPMVADLERVVDEAFPLDVPRGIDARILAHNGGKRPDPRRATDLVIEHLFSVDRLATFYQRCVTSKALPRELAAVVTGILRVPAVRAAITRHATAVLRDPEVTRRIIGTMGLLVDEKATAAQVEAAFYGLLDSAAFRRELVSLLGEIRREPEAAKLASALGKNLAEDPEIKAHMQWLLAEW